MSMPMRILLADNDETFLLSTADLLRREGHHCECAPDADSARGLMQNSHFELLIADINMPGNPQLELVESLAASDPSMPVILVTGYPSMQSAVRSIHLPVIAYLLKPIPFDELRHWVSIAQRQRQLSAAVKDLRTRLHEWDGELAGIEELMLQRNRPGSSVSVEDFMQLTLRNLIASMLDLRNLTQEINPESQDTAVCHLLACPRLDELSSAIRHTIKVLHNTKQSFKSKELGALRHQLESFMESDEHTQGAGDGPVSRRRAGDPQAR